MEVKRGDLIQQLVGSGYTKTDATSIIDDFVSIVLDNLAKGNTVSIRNFGKFGVLERKARSCPDPQTGESISIPAHLIPRFYPGYGMRMVVKMYEDNKKRGIG